MWLHHCFRNDRSKVASDKLLRTVPQSVYRPRTIQHSLEAFLVTRHRQHHLETVVTIRLSRRPVEPAKVHQMHHIVKPLSNLLGRYHVLLDFSLVHVVKQCRLEEVVVLVQFGVVYELFYVLSGLDVLGGLFEDVTLGLIP